MQQEKDYIKDITEIRTMMERSSKFLSLAGFAGVIAGITAILGAYIACKLYGFNPDRIVYSQSEVEQLTPTLMKIISLALIILVLAIGSAIFLSYKKANKRGEKLWDATAKRVVLNMAVPLGTGGILILILIANGLLGLIAPFTLLFYGLALFNASKFTYPEVKSLGLIQIGLGLISAYFIEYGLLIWAFGFGLAHIIYGIYMHYKYEK